MQKTKKCPMCGRRAEQVLENYNSGVMDRSGSEEIVVNGIETYLCQNAECSHYWMPADQEKKIKKVIASESRWNLTPEEISRVRECLPFKTKYETASFLCMNEKAFVKWENGYSEPNNAYDLLLRLAAYSSENVEFIRHLHSVNFRFVPSDYELICDKHGFQWTFDALKVSTVKKNTNSYIVDGMYKAKGDRFVRAKCSLGDSGEDDEKAKAA